MTSSQPRLRSRRVLLGISLIIFLFFWLVRRGTPTHPRLLPTANNTLAASIIIPAYHEQPNIRPLVTRIFHALQGNDTEVIIVDDDSRDGTKDVVHALREEGYNVVLIIRTFGPGSTATKGLSSAVLRGMHEARGNALIVMDADLQHPPESLPHFLTALANPATPLALGTRYAPGVSISSHWPLHRRVISWGARSLARPLTTASDPMTGFFGIAKRYADATKDINPTGFKIALELLLKAPLPPHAIAEIPFKFSTRTVGSSKLSSRVMLRYVFQLIALYYYVLGMWLVVLVLGVSSLLAWGGVLAGKWYMEWRRGGMGRARPYGPRGALTGRNKKRRSSVENTKNASRSTKGKSNSSKKQARHGRATRMEIVDS